MLVRGPVGTRTIYSVAARYVSIRNFTAEVGCDADLAAGMSR